ncbi:MAG: hypothetical protein AAGF98_00315 [Cyanobacteria bacterium P01_H01_bin.153]
MTKATEKPLEIDNLPSNEDRLSILRCRKNLKSVTFWLSSTIAFAMLLHVNPFVIVPLLISSSAATGIAKCARVEAMLTELEKEFKDTDMQVFSLLGMVEPGAPKREYEQVDLHLRFRDPKRTQIFITVRSMGKNSVVYSEGKESLLIKRKNRDRTVVTPCPLIGLNENREWLTRNRKELGLSSRDVTKAATAKVLVLWNETKLAKHRDELYSEIGNGRYLTLFKRGVKTFVVEQERLATFVRDWLTHLSN